MCPSVRAAVSCYTYFLGWINRKASCTLRRKHQNAIREDLQYAFCSQYCSWARIIVAAIIIASCIFTRFWCKPTATQVQSKPSSDFSLIVPDSRSKCTILARLQMWNLSKSRATGWRMQLEVRVPQRVWKMFGLYVIKRYENWLRQPEAQGRRQRGGSGARPPPIWNLCPPISRLDPGCSIHPIQYFKNEAPLLVFGPSFWFLASPAATSWRRACSDVTIEVSVKGGKRFWRVPTFLAHLKGAHLPTLRKNEKWKWIRT